MPIQRSLGGILHTFPDDAGDDEIAEALGQTPDPTPTAAFKASQHDVRQIDNAIEEKAQYTKMLGERNLGSKDKKLYSGFFIPAHEQLQIERDDLTATNLDALEKEIANAKDPAIKKVLLEEHERMKTAFANILGIK